MTCASGRLGRLLNRGDFRRVSATGRRSRTTHLGLSVTANGLDQVRVGITVPEKTAKSAVRRNRLKRVIREFLRQSAPPIPPGNDLVVTVMCDPGIGEGKVISDELLKLLRKSGILKAGVE